MKSTNLIHLARRGVCLCFLVSVVIGSIRAQVPDLVEPLRVNVLGATDLDTTRPPAKNNIVLGANRVAEKSDEIAVKTYIISREQILQNGWTTLLDILRTVPGFQISEPANALLGEAFMMRGMLGNIYTKILINGVPILPSAAPGQPLGANLPIKQAERIEIVLGPATTVYGNDALAGVINIVIAEVERPVEARASLAVGAPNMDEFHLMIAGKAGGSKRVLQYQLFGSTRQMKDRNLDFRDSILQVDSGLVAGLADWQAADTSDITLPRLADYPHQSRLLGAGIQYGPIKLMGIRMYRKDHASITQSPLEVSYSDPYTFIADNITNLQAQFDKTFGKVWIHTNASYLQYAIDVNSAYMGIDHPVSNGRNFMYATSKDLLLEQLANYSAKRWSLLLGANYLRKTGAAFQSYLAKPFAPADVAFDSLANNNVIANAAGTGGNIGPKSIFNEYDLNDLGLFGQGSFHTDRLNLIGGLRLDRFDTIPGDIAARTEKAIDLFRLSWRVGGFVKVTEGLRFRAVASRAFRSAGTFYEFNNYRYERVGMEPQPSYKRSTAYLGPERILNVEMGVVTKPTKWLTLELSAFGYRMDSLILFDQNAPRDTSLVQGSPNVFVGYRNDSAAAILGAIQLSAEMKFKYFSAEISAQVNGGREQFSLDTVQFYRGVPNFQANLALNFEKENWFRASVYVRYLDTIPGYYLQKVNDHFFYTGASRSYNVDAMLGRTFVKRIFLYVRAKNLLNTASRGITTNFISERQLAYVPQEKRFFIFGVNFSL